MTTTLVTGSHGWVGHHLRRQLVARGHNVVGVGRRQRTVPAGERYLQLNLRDAPAVAAAVDAIRPTVVLHLAATVPQRNSSLTDVVADAVESTYNLCRALRTADVGTPPHLVLAGSAAQYGGVPSAENPISEDTLPRPLNTYGHAKAAAESLALAMAADGRLRVTVARPFNHVGPGESSATLAGALASRIAAVLAGRSDRVQVADLDAVRDFTDVRDVARAYVELAEISQAEDIYNVCSGSGVTVRTVLETLLDLANLDHRVVELIEGRSAIRFQVGSAERLAARTGWKAEIPLRESLRELLTELTDRPAHD
ncbi:NAD(P)-dependent oxidoreductase [Micromonospora sp. NPDC049374]|uniref:NAD-dependent epimerase/dehydratase family protein n=1 Tax=Micromonospora sp. NPDC049374 TaxID=3154352 RepID=UPI00342390FE